jgi:general secretion pathway protein D
MTGGTIDEPIRTKDKIPVLGDIPLLGRMFRSEHDATIQKRLFVLITATRIDPAGNPLRPVAAVRKSQTVPDR